MDKLKSHKVEESAAESARVYADIDLELSQSLETLLERTGDDELDRAQDEAAQVISAQQLVLRSQLADLQKNSEWDVFTMAFYGETNAGKSTIIETVRILLAEATKVDQSKAFLELESRYGLTGEEIDRRRAELAELACAEAPAAKALEELKQRLALQEEALQDKLAGCVAKDAAERAARPWWKRLYAYVMRAPTSAELSGLEAELARVRERNADALVAQDAMVQAIRDRYAVAEIAVREQENQLAALREHADGEIIGDGRSDFTRAVNSYTFDLGDRSFTLLDVPGIEGKVELVQQAIGNAVQKAHAVFYVMNHAAPPQAGTLETMRNHLGSQTEVRAIFNKKISNPIPLGKSQLLSQGEAEALAELDDRMRECFGHHYRGSLVLSAGPAFLASARCLVPGSASAAARAKFLEAMDAQSLLVKSRFQDFIDFVGTTMVDDCRRKIVESNLRKVDAALQESITTISAQQKAIGAVARKLEKTGADAAAILRRSAGGLKRRLRLRCNRLAESFKSDVTREMYDLIDTGVGKDAFKDALQHALDAHLAALQDKLFRCLEEELERFGSEAEDAIRRANEKADGILMGQIGAIPASFMPDFRMDDGLRLASLGTTVIGGLLMAWNPGGWILLTIGVAGLLVSAGKAVFAYFSEDYKKGQQRAVVDRNLHGATEDIRAAMKSNLDEAFPLLDAKVAQIEAKLGVPAARAGQVQQVMGASVVRLKKISKKVIHGERIR